jgi:ABC-type phosphate/phosphonate transport system substrate-binding protein
VAPTSPEHPQPLSSSPSTSFSFPPNESSYSQLPVYYSQLFVHNQSPYQTFSDLFGARLAYNDDSSLSGYYCLLFYLQSAATVALSTSPSSSLLPYFSIQITTGSHQNSILTVLSGQADVLCLDCVVYQRLLNNSSFRSELLKLRPIPVPPLFLENGRSLSTAEGLLGPNPAQPIVVTGQISRTLRHKIQAAFQSLSSELLMKTISPCLCPSSLSPSPSLSSCCSCSSRYESVTKSDYDSIIKMMRSSQNLQMGQQVMTVSEAMAMAKVVVREEEQEIVG